MYKYYDKKNNFVETFNPETGFYIRSDDLTTGKEPFMRNFPALLDIGVMSMGHLACVFSQGFSVIRMDYTHRSLICPLRISRE